MSIVGGSDLFLLVAALGAALAVGVLVPAAPPALRVDGEERSHGVVGRPFASVVEIGRAHV